MDACLYLFPSNLADNTPIEQYLPAENIRLISGIKFFIVEDLRSARRFLKKCNSQIDINSLTFFELNEHTDRNNLIHFLTPLKKGNNMGLLSEAGCPAVADPGADIVAIIQQMNIKVIPLVGPSSILLALMGSGFNGQSFAFQGYLPIKSNERTHKIRQFESQMYSENQTQIFIETPYRNNKLLAELVAVCAEETKICIAADLTTPSEFIRTLKVSEWKKQMPDLNKRPVVFLIYK